MALGATALAWWGWLPAAPLPFVAHKVLHLIGIVTFGGNGLWAAQTFGGLRAQPWLTEAVLATVVTSVVSCTVVLWSQERLVAAAERDGALPTATLAVWSVFGTLVSLPLSWAFWLMVSKSAVLVR